jgi:hypothetical protein
LSGDKNTENRGWKTVAGKNDGKWRRNGTKKTLKKPRGEKKEMISKVNTDK